MVTVSPVRAVSQGKRSLFGDEEMKPDGMPGWEEPEEIIDPVIIWTEYAQKVTGLKDWHPWKFERVHGAILLTGAVCEYKKDGTPNYRKHDKSTKCVVAYPIKD